MSNSSAVAAVLTNEPLLRRVTAFLPGLPLFAGEFAHRESWRVSPNGWYPLPLGRVTQLAVLAGDVGFLSQLHVVSLRPHYKNLPELQFFEVVRCATLCDRIQVLEWIATALDLRVYPFEPDLLDVAVSYCSGVAVLEWLHVHTAGMYWQVGKEAMHRAIGTGKLEMLHWLHDHNYEGFTTDCMNIAAATDQLEVVRFLHHHRREGCTTQAMDESAKGGFLEVVEFLHSNRTEGCTTQAMDDAARNGHCDVVKFLHENRSEGCTTQAMADAAIRGHHAVVEFLATHRHEGTPPDTLGWVVAQGDVEMVRLLCRFTDSGCLHDERRHATSRYDAAVVVALGEFMDLGVTSCSIHNHRTDWTGRSIRPCQRPETRDKDSIGKARVSGQHQPRDIAVNCPKSRSNAAGSEHC